MMPRSFAPSADVWEKHVMALEDVTRRLERICDALQRQGVPFAFVGGQAVAMWVASVDPSAVRTTKDVDLLLQRVDLSAARKAARSAGMDYFEVLGVGMFLDQEDPNPRHAVHLLWAGEKVRPEHPYPAPTIDQRELLSGDRPVVRLSDLVLMKLMSNRDQDRVHLRDMIDVDLVTRELVHKLPPDLAGKLDELLAESGR